MTLHLVRPAAEPVVAEGDWVVYLQPLRLAAHPALPPGPIDHDQLVALCFAARRVVTW